MAKLVTGDPGPAQLILRFDIVEKVPRQGFICRTGVEYNSERDMLRAMVSYWVGERQIIEQEVYIHNDYASVLYNQLMEMREESGEELQRGATSSDSPEVTMAIIRHENGCEFFIVLERAFVGGVEGEISLSGPALYFALGDEEELVQFLRDLRSESEVAMLIG